MSTHEIDVRRTAAGPSAWQHVVHVDRLRALARTHPTDVRVQPVDARCWRVVDASASWGDPDMLLGFIEHTEVGFECTLMATLRETRRVDTLTDAGEYFRLLCGGSEPDA